jgi:hypothetical protein
MQSVEVVMKEGATKVFRAAGRAGGSYSLSVRYEGAFVIVTDEWGNTVAIPAADVKEVRTHPRPRW